jgi:hypothetical protein
MTAPAPSAAPAAPAGARRIWFEGTALALAAAALAVGAGFLPRGGGIRPLPERATALPVQAREVALVERYEREQSYWGEVRARRSSALSFERAATVVTVAVDEGQAVRAGELLAELDRGGLEAQLAAQDAGLEAARARLAELRAGPRREQLAAARARLAQRSAAVDLARALEGRRRLLRDSDAVALEELEAAELERAAGGGPWGIGGGGRGRPRRSRPAPRRPGSSSPSWRRAPAPSNWRRRWPRSRSSQRGARRWPTTSSARRCARPSTASCRG